MKTDGLLEQSVRRNNGNINVLRELFSTCQRVRKPAHGLFLERIGDVSPSRVAAPALPAPRDAPKHTTAVTAHPRPRREDLGHLDRIEVLLVPTHFITAACKLGQA